MDNKLINGLYPKKGNQDWKVVSLGIKVETFKQELARLESHAKEKNGFINIDVCLSKDKTKMYTILDDYIAEKKEQVTASQHSPDREDVDLPF